MLTGWDTLSALIADGPAPPTAPTLTDALRAALAPPAERPWRALARPEQLPPPDDAWLYWVLCAGRGFGKSFSGSNTLAEMAVAEPGDYAAIGPTFGDARKIMTEGPTGLLAALGDDLGSYSRNEFVLSLRNGSRIVLASADVPDRVRGWNLRGAWLDELASMRGAQSLWDEALLPALRIGDRPRAIITTTPRRGSSVLAELLGRADAGDKDVAVTRGSTMDNRANLSPAFIKAIYARFGGTTIGAQELEGQLLQEAEAALLTSDLIECSRVRPENVPELSRVVVGVDPAVTSGPDSDLTGITVAGLGPAPVGWLPRKGLFLSGLPHVYLLQDASLRASPEGWAQRVLDVAETWCADAVVVEVNQGGQMCESTLRMVGAATLAGAACRQRARLPGQGGPGRAAGAAGRAGPLAHRGAAARAGGRVDQLGARLHGEVARPARRQRVGQRRAAAGTGAQGADSDSDLGLDAGRPRESSTPGVAVPAGTGPAVPCLALPAPPGLA